MPDRNKDKVPRKLKKQIPDGPYCYTLTGETSQVWNAEIQQFVTAYHSRLCPMYVHLKMKDLPAELQDEISKEFPEEWIGYCKLIKLELTDDCKSCTIKRNY